MPLALATLPMATMSSSLSPSSRATLRYSWIISGLSRYSLASHFLVVTFIDVYSNSAKMALALLMSLAWVAPPPASHLSKIFVVSISYSMTILSHIDDTLSRAGKLFVEVRGMAVRLIVEKLSTCIRMEVLLILLAAYFIRLLLLLSTHNAELTSGGLPPEALQNIEKLINAQMLKN